MHRDGPGSLGVVFGPDGGFEGAPLWRPPLWGTLRPRKGNPPDENDGQTGFVFRYTLNTTMHGDADLAVVMDGPAAIWGIGGAALDCRVPSVAARLAGLCARALGGPSDARLRMNDESVSLVGDRWQVTWQRDGGWEIVTPDDPRFSCPRMRTHETAASFLASLTLTLAPRIAGLAARC